MCTSQLKSPSYCEGHRDGHERMRRAEWPHHQQGRAGASGHGPADLRWPAIDLARADRRVNLNRAWRGPPRGFSTTEKALTFGPSCCKVIRQLFPRAQVPQYAPDTDTGSLKVRKPSHKRHCTFRLNEGAAD